MLAISEPGWFIDMALSLLDTYKNETSRARQQECYVSVVESKIKEYTCPSRLNVRNVLEITQLS